jgi:hypothetical protein
MTFEAELPYLRPLQHLWIGRAVRLMTRGTAFKLQRTMFEDERPLLVGVTLYARRIGTDSEFCLLLLETAVRIMAIAALHRPLEDLVMERLAEL